MLTFRYITYPKSYMVYAVPIPDLNDPQVQYEVSRVQQLQSMQHDLERKFDKNFGKWCFLHDLERARINGVSIPKLIRMYRRILPKGITESNCQDLVIREIDRLYFSTKNLNGRINTIHEQYHMYPQGRTVLNC